MSAPQKKLPTGRFQVLSISKEEEKGVVPSNKSPSFPKKIFGSDLLEKADGVSVPTDPICVALECNHSPGILGSSVAVNEGKDPVNAKSSKPVAVSKNDENTATETKIGSTMARSVGSFSVLQHPQDTTGSGSPARKSSPPASSFSSDPLGVTNKEKVLALEQNGAVQVNVYVNGTDQSWTASAPVQSKTKANQAITEPAKSPQKAQTFGNTRAISTGRFALLHNPAEPVLPVAASEPAPKNKPQPLGADPAGVSKPVKSGMVSSLEESGLTRGGLWAVSTQVWQHSTAMEGEEALAQEKADTTVKKKQQKQQNKQQQQQARKAPPPQKNKQQQQKKAAPERNEKPTEASAASTKTVETGRFALLHHPGVDIVPIPAAEATSKNKPQPLGADPRTVSEPMKAKALSTDHHTGATNFALWAAGGAVWQHSKETTKEEEENVKEENSKVEPEKQQKAKQKQKKKEAAKTQTPAQASKDAQAENGNGAQKKHLLVLVSLQSMDRGVTANQEKARTVLGANGVAFETLDGADPANKSKRNELFTMSGIRAKYPQFFIVDGASTTFWGDWEKFEMTNEANQIATEFEGVAPAPVAAVAAGGRAVIETPTKASVAAFAAQFDKPSNVALMPDKGLTAAANSHSHPDAAAAPAQTHQSRAVGKTNVAAFAAQFDKPKGKGDPAPMASPKREKVVARAAASPVRETPVKSRETPVKSPPTKSRETPKSEGTGIAAFKAQFDKPSNVALMPDKDLTAAANAKLEEKGGASEQAVAPPEDGGQPRKHLLVLVSLQSFDRAVVANQDKATTVLGANGVKFETLDGADQANKEKRNELFTMSGIRAKYPQFFIVDGDNTTFWGDWDKFEAANESNEIASEFASLATPLSPEQRTQEPSEPNAKFLVLFSNQSLNREVLANQQKAFHILKDRSIPFDSIDGADQTNKEKRNELFTLSGFRGHYPQFFLVKGGETTFWGTWDQFEETNDEDGFKSIFVAAKNTEEPKPEPTGEQDGEPPASGAKFLVLFSNQSLNREVLANQQKAFNILKDRSIPFDSIDGADQANKEKRNELFAISGFRGQYPQFFLVKGGETTFWGTWDQFEETNDEDGFKSILVASAATITEEPQTEEVKVQEREIPVPSDAQPEEKSRSIDFAALSQPESVNSPETDITVYGATGFVAKHVFSYLLQSSIHLGQKLKITLAGRNSGALESMRTSLSEKNKNLVTISNVEDAGAEFDVFVADASDNAKLRAMAARSRVIINCAGPYALVGTGVVAACAETGTDYVDITGEVHWASEMRERYSDDSKKSGSRIVSFCGFDSIPSDMAVFAAVDALRRDVGENTEIVKASTWHACFGLPGAGTVHTVVGIPMRLWENFARLPVPFLIEDPLALTHPKVRKDSEMNETRKRLAKAEWANQLPMYHSFLMGGFSAPFVMAVANSKVVHESAVALKYGPEFVYYERFLPVGFRASMHMKGFTVIPAVIVQIGVLLGVLLLKLPIVGPWLASTLFPVGSGSSDIVCQNGYSEVYAEVETGPDANGKVNKANSFLKFKGDAGNWVTAQCVSEAALCLLLERQSLPPRSEDGFGSPAEILGGTLLERLTNSKTRPAQLSTNVRKATNKVEWRMFD